MESLTTAVELQEINPSSSSLASRGLAFADLKYVGVASDYPARKAAGGNLAGSFMYFGIVVQQPWSTPNEVTVSIGIDTNSDNQDDYTVETGDLDVGYDIPVAAICRNSTGDCTLTALQTVKPEVRDTAPFSSNALVIRVPLDLAGVSETASRLTYRVSTARNGYDETLDQSSKHTFDPVHPGLAFRGIGYAGTAAVQPLYQDLPGSSAQVVLSQSDYATDQGLGVLLVHHHNAGDRAQVLAVGSGVCSLVLDALVPATGRPGEALAMQAALDASGCTAAPGFVWEFGDGTTKEAGESVSHTYDRAGLFTWQVTASSGAFSTTRAGTIWVDESGRGTARRRLGRSEP